MANKRSREQSLLPLKNIKRIGRLSYHREDLIGTGSYGRVFRGKFKESEEKPEIDVAIKRIENIDVKDVEKVFMESIKPHSNVLQYYCIEEDDDFLYIVTELCAGTLDDIIQGNYKGPPVGSPREMMRQIARGVHHLHQHNIVHRSITPNDILVSFPDQKTNTPPQMKLADFGLCHVVKTDGSHSSITKSGSKGWMAPELYNKTLFHEKEDIFALDVFSLGCVFAYSLSKGNRHPFGTGNLREYRIENNEDMILTYDDFDQHDRALFQLIRCMLHPNAKQRYTIEQVMEHPFFIEGINEEYSCSWIISKDYEAIISGLDHMKVDNTYNAISRDSNGCTPLMLLCCKKLESKNGKRIQLLDYVEKFLNFPNIDYEFVNAKDNKGNTALMLLCEHYNGDDLIEIIRLLIQKGANVNHVTVKNGLNALMLLCMQYHDDKLTNIIRLFIESGVKLDSRNTEDGWNVLHILCRYYNHNALIDAIALLIEHGIDLNAVTIKDNWNAITFLCLYYTGEHMMHIIHLLIDNGLNVNSMTRSKGLNALGCVCSLYNRSDLIYIIRLLIHIEPSVVTCTDKKTNSNSLIMVCSQEYARSGPDNLIDIVHLLIENGVDVNCTTFEGWNALMYVCRDYRHPNLIDIVKLLVSYGIDVNCKTNHGMNAFLLISRNQYLHHTTCIYVIHMFIDLLAEVNAVYQVDGENALTYLFKYHQNCDKLVDIIRLILEKSPIDVNHKNKKGESAISILRSKDRLLMKNSEAMMQLLIEHGAV